MLHGAAHILGPVSALHVDPFALAEAQVEGTDGYVLISIGEEDDRRTYIVIFFEGPRVRECVRLEREERSFVDISTVRTTIASAERDHAMVHLFTLDRPHHRPISGDRAEGPVSQGPGRHIDPEANRDPCARIALRQHDCGTERFLGQPADIRIPVNSAGSSAADL